MYFYIQGFDYYKAQIRIADMLFYERLGPSSPFDTLTAYKLYNQSAEDSGYGMYSTAYMHQNGLGTAKDEEVALRMYDTVIKRAGDGWYPFEEMFPAYL